MEYALQPHLYRNVPVYLWPWLFWQLFAIALWVEQTGRDVMLAVAKNGRVHIRHIGEDPDTWSPRDLHLLGKQLARAMQAPDWLALANLVGRAPTPVGARRASTTPKYKNPTVPGHPWGLTRDLPQPRPP